MTLKELTQLVVGCMILAAIASGVIVVFGVGDLGVG